MKLKPIDFKLLNYLYHNHNESISKIAKATKISRDKIEYRLNKYQKEGLIKVQSCINRRSDKVLG